LKVEALVRALSIVADPDALVAAVGVAVGVGLAGHDRALRVEAHAAVDAVGVPRATVDRANPGVNVKNIFGENVRRKIGAFYSTAL
jgi:hypothetical protein